ncbi:Synaptotagmin-4 [Galdieria sulphuraria]|nr:Synaptotagmin-4 [Galdieria sulphuraria]
MRYLQDWRWIDRVRTFLVVWFPLQRYKVHCLLLLLAYILGKSQFPVIYIVLLAYAVYLFDRERQVRRELRDRIELSRRESVAQEDTCTELPSTTEHQWVPGVNIWREESCEWFNVLVKKLWVTENVGLSRWLRERIASRLNLTRPKFVEVFQIPELKLGTKAPECSHVRVNRIKSSYEMQLEFDLHYTGTAFVILVINFSRQIFGVQIPILLSDFAFAAKALVHVQLVDRAPYFSVVHFSFIRKPWIDLKLVPLKTLDMMDIPVLSDWIRRHLTDTIQDWAVYPRKVSFPIESWYQASQQGKDLKDVMVGMVRVKIKEARDLHPPVFGGTVNAFVVLYLGTQKKRTRVVHGSLHPVWSQSFEFFVQDPLVQNVFIYVLNAPTGKGEKEDLLGLLELPLKGLVGGETISNWYSLDDAASDKSYNWRGAWKGQKSPMESRNQPPLQQSSSNVTAFQFEHDYYSQSGETQRTNPWVAGWLNGTIPANPGFASPSHSPPVKKSRSLFELGSLEAKKTNDSSSVVTSESKVSVNSLLDKVSDKKNESSMTIGFQTTKRKLNEIALAALASLRTASNKAPFEESSPGTSSQRITNSCETSIFDPLRMHFSSSEYREEEDKQHPMRKSMNAPLLYDHDQHLSLVASNFGGVLQVTIIRGFGLSFGNKSRSSSCHLLGFPMILLQLEDQIFETAPFQGEDRENPYWNETFELYCVNILRQSYLSLG